MHFILLTFACFESTYARAEFTITPVSRDTIVADSSHIGCAQKLLNFYWANYEGCSSLEVQGHAVAENIIQSQWTALCNDMHRCHATFKCNLLSDFSECSRDFLEPGLSGEFAMFCPSWTNVWLEGEGENAQVLCLNHEELQTKILALNLDDVALDAELKRRLRRTWERPVPEIDPTLWRMPSTAYRSGAFVYMDLTSPN